VFIIIIWYGDWRERLVGKPVDAQSIGCDSVPRGKTTCPFCLEMAVVGVASTTLNGIDD
jgi:hypothetical protein